MNEFEEYKIHIRCISNFISACVQGLGYRNCTAYFGDTFSYDYVNDVITYSFDDPAHEDDLYFELCREYKPEIIQCDNFIISLLHEVGHCATDPNWSLDEWFEYITFVKKFDETEPTDEDYMTYYKKDIEYTATKWACDFIVNNRDKVNELINGLKLIAPSFYQWKDLIVCDKI